MFGVRAYLQVDFSHGFKCIRYAVSTCSFATQSGSVVRAHSQAFFSSRCFGAIVSCKRFTRKPENRHTICNCLHYTTNAQLNTPNYRTHKLIHELELEHHGLQNEHLGDNQAINTDLTQQSSKPHLLNYCRCFHHVNM